MICRHCTDIESLFYSGVSVVAHSFGFVSGLMVGAMVLRDTNETVWEHIFQSYHIEREITLQIKHDFMAFNGHSSSCFFYFLYINIFFID